MFVLTIPLAVFCLFVLGCNLIDGEWVSHDDDGGRVVGCGCITNGGGNDRNLKVIDNKYGP